MPDKHFVYDPASKLKVLIPQNYATFQQYNTVKELKENDSVAKKMSVESITDESGEKTQTEREILTKLKLNK